MTEIKINTLSNKKTSIEHVDDIGKEKSSDAGVKVRWAENVATYMKKENPQKYPEIA
jgi:hypothetical protein